MKKTTKTKKSIIYILCLGMMIVSFPYKTALANTQEKAVETGEIIEKREMYVKHFQNEDGTILAASYPYPVHYQDERGNWKDVDNNMIYDIEYQTNSLKPLLKEEQDVFLKLKDNPYISVYMNKYTSANEQMKVEVDGYEMAMGIEGLKTSQAAIVQNESNSEYNLENITGEICITKYRSTLLCNSK